MRNTTTSTAPNLMAIDLAGCRFNSDTPQLTTRPPVSDVLQTLPVGAPTAQSLEAYAPFKTTADRSKLWLELQRHHYLANHLRAVGKHGINGAAVAALSNKINSADLETQRTLVGTLLTAQLGVDTTAKQEATQLAIALLTSGVTGSGKLAAQITLNARGAAQGQTKALRAAYDSFTAQHPRTINKTDLRALNDLNLLTKRKKSPVSTILGWVFN